MQTKQILKGGFAAAATLSMLVACGPAPTTTPTPSPSSTASATPSAEPTTAPTAEPTASPTAAPTAEPTAAPSATASPSSSPSTSPSESPSATATSDISVVEKTTFNGKVYDDEGSPLDGVTVKAKSLNSSVPYDASTTTAGGTYAFNNAPAGVQIEISASKNGYTTRRRVEVLKSNKTGDPNANRYDFGTEDGVSNDPDVDESGDFGIGYNGLSDKPEVVSVTPGRNASGVDPSTSFVLKFSEPMDTDTVEDNFAIYSATDEDLSVDFTVDGVTDDSTDGVTAETSGASLIYDDSDFDISWNSDDTEVTFTFADEAHLPTDTESSNTPDYLVTFSEEVEDGQIKDKSGVTRDESDGGYFKLTDGDFEMWYDFSIDTDEEEPQVVSVEATDSDNDTDEIRVEFSEPMMLNTREGQIMGFGDESPLNEDNYEYTTVDNPDDGDFGPFDPDVTTRFDSDDDTNSTVLIQGDEAVANLFTAGDLVTVRVSRDVVDPAGNSVDSSNDEEDDTAN